MAKPVVLSNGRNWPTRKAALAHFKAMLARHSNGSIVTDPQDASDLLALLIRYDGVLPPGAPTKTGSGVSHFSRDSASAEGWPTDCFHVHRTDGSKIDFSYIDAVNL
jgi:hypothetical protein